MGSWDLPEQPPKQSSSKTVVDPARKRRSSRLRMQGQANVLEELSSDRREVKMDADHQRVWNGGQPGWKVPRRAAAGLAVLTTLP